jgi:hypothetical protein
MERRNGIGPFVLVACLGLGCSEGAIRSRSSGDSAVLPSDAGADARALDCAGLDECTCVKANGCSVITDTCYCPFSKCLQGGACGCGGGKFLGCAPVHLNTCAAAKARVAGMCPTLSGTTFDGLCQESDSACVTACLNDVTACEDVRCTFCEICDCAGDAFSTCRAKCRSALAPSGVP